MKVASLLILLIFTLTVSGQVKKSNWFFSTGIDYRDYPIDIEDLPRGPQPTSRGQFYGNRFWLVFSIHCRLGIDLKKNWQLSTAVYGRYNHLYWPERGQFEFLPNEFQQRKDHKNFKYDLFLDVQKKFSLKKTKPRYFLVMAGVGIMNINTRYDVSYKQDTLPSGTVRIAAHYQGNLTQIAPRLSLGYQYNRIKGTIDAYVIEGSDLIGLTALWLGATISYEILIKKKK